MKIFTDRLSDTGNNEVYGSEKLPLAQNSLICTASQADMKALWTGPWYLTKNKVQSVNISNEQ